MKVKITTLQQLKELYTHPSAFFFRAIELHTIYEKCKDFQFEFPSLDLGCGDGKIAQVLFDSPFTYGIDNGEAKDVQEAVGKGIYSKVFIENATKMSIPDRSINFVFSNCVIEHIPDNKSVLREINRVLNKNGHLVFTVPSHLFPDYLYLTNKLLSCGLGFFSELYKYRRNKMLNQFHCYSITDWEDKLRKFGFEIIQYKYYMPKKCLMLWDRMALEIFITKLFNRNAEDIISRKYEEEILDSYENSNVINDEGAALFIHCIKSK